MSNKEKILFDHRGFMADPTLRVCRPEAIGVYITILMIQHTGGMALRDNESYMQRMKQHRTTRGRLAVFALYLDEMGNTTDFKQTLRGLQELYDRGIIRVGIDNITISPQFDYASDVNVTFYPLSCKKRGKLMRI